MAKESDYFTQLEANYVRLTADDLDDRGTMKLACAILEEVGNKMRDIIRQAGIHGWKYVKHDANKMSDLLQSEFIYALTLGHSEEVYKTFKMQLERSLLTDHDSRKDA